MDASRLRPIELWQDASFEYELAVTDANGGPVDLAGVEVLAQIRATSESPSAYAEMIVDASSAPSGIVVLSLAPSATAAIPTGVHTWDARLVYPSGRKVPVIPQSDVTVYPDVSR